MTVFLIIISLYGGIERVPMNDEAVCAKAASVFNDRISTTAKAFCIKNAP